LFGLGHFICVISILSCLSSSRTYFRLPFWGFLLCYCCYWYYWP